MTDSLKERLRALAARREMEGIYTDRNIAELALARIEELEAINLAQSLQVSEKIEQFQATIAKLEEEIKRIKSLPDNYFYGRGRISMQAKLDVANSTIAKLEARIEELERENRVWQNQGLAEQCYRQAETIEKQGDTIAKLEGENKRMRGIDEWIDNELSKVTMLESRVTDRDETIAILQGKLDRARKGLEKIERGYESVPGATISYSALKMSEIARSILSDLSPDGKPE